MKTVTEKENCCGCSACFNICPHSAIKMEKDEEGFFYPVIQKSLCTNCNLCVDVCNRVNNKESRMPLKSLAAKNSNSKIRKESSSGGIFSLLAENIIEKGGIVYGAKFNSNWEVAHDHAVTKDDLFLFRGSKYVESYLGKSFREIKTFLEKDSYVLFSGTPCQVSGLLSFLKKDYKKLLTVELICHGIPSSEVWQKYIAEKTNKERITEINFRDKNPSWDNYKIKIISKDKIVSELARKNEYMKGFLQDLYLRLSCYNCKHRNFKSGSDFTIGDYWGIKEEIPSFYDSTGVSAVLVNTQKGLSVFEEIKSETVCVETSLESVIKHNPALKNSFPVNLNRKNFFKDLKETDKICKTINKYTKPPLIKRLESRVKRVIKKIIKG